MIVVRGLLEVVGLTVFDESLEGMIYGDFSFLVRFLGLGPVEDASLDFFRAGP
jgi:hypothetical protein